MTAGERRTRTGDRGSVVIEMAVLWPVVLLVVFGAVQVTTYFTARTVAQSAAQVAVGTERQYDTPSGAGQQRAEEFLAGTGDWLVDAEVGDPAGDEDHVFVTVRGRALSIVPGVSWEIQQSARGTRERFTEAG